MIVFDASVVVSAALHEDGVPERALRRSEATDFFALLAEVDTWIASVLKRQARILDVLRAEVAQFIFSYFVTKYCNRKREQIPENPPWPPTPKFETALCCISLRYYTTSRRCARERANSC